MPGSHRRSPYRRRPDYLTRHWQGDLSLACSYWLNDVVLAGLVVYAATRFVAWCAGRIDDPRVMLLPVAAAALAILSCKIWAVVGTWRAANRRAAAGFARRARITKAVTLYGLLSIGTTFATDGNELAAAIAAERPMTVNGITIRRQGTEIDYVGPIDATASTRLEAALASAPGARTLRLASGGGLVQQARSMSALVRSRNLDTLVDGHCESACTILFFAGRHRLLWQGGRLGFHGYSTIDHTALPSAALWAAESVEDRAYADAGVPSWFISRIFAKPPNELWYPTPAELTEARFVTRTLPGG